MIETGNSSRDSKAPSERLESLLKGISDRFLYWALSAITAYSLLRSITYALAKPLWFDEVLTYVVCRQGKPTAIWAALKQGVDGNPPTFYILEHFAASLTPNEHLGYRLLSIIGFVGTLLLLFVFLRTRYGLQRALLCSSLLLITPLFTLYAEEARPYSLVAALIALAMVCYQRLPNAAWAAGLCFTLVLATLLHYYAPLTLAPFFLAEFAVVCFSKQIRFRVWFALLTPLVPIAIAWPRLMWMKQNWGPHFWAGAGLSDISAAYGNYFRVGSPWGTAIGGLGILIMLVPLFYRYTANQSKTSSAELHGTPLAERILIAGFIALPVVGFAVAKFTHGPFVERYFLASIFGIVVAAAFVLQRASPKTIFGAAILLCLAVSSQEIGFWKSWVARRTPASIIAPVANLADASPYRDLPIVVSDAGEYVELWHYAPPDLFKRVVTLPDPELAATYAGTDTVDRLVLALRNYGLPGIQDFPAFTAEHPRFLLYSNGSPFDWWPTRLSHDGYQLQLIKPSFHSAVYLVGPKPN